jgi:L-lactate dehydrogenase complex protein LldG
MTGSRSARQEILDRIGAALADRPAPSPVPRDYHAAGSATRPPGAVDDLELFAERAADYQAVVHRCAAAEIAATVARILADRGISQIVSPPGLPDGWLDGDGDGDVVPDRPPLSIYELDRMDGVLTGCAVAIAQTGTIVLDHGPGQGRRALTLIPDHHLVVVLAAQIVSAVPDALAVLDPRRPLTWISGPSATSDIELSRVEGVHGPRKLDIILAD